MKREYQQPHIGIETLVSNSILMTSTNNPSYGGNTGAGGMGAE